MAASAAPTPVWRSGRAQFGTVGWSLHIRWLWLEKTEGSRPWAGLDIQVSQCARAMLEMAVRSEVGNGKSTKFWLDRWLDGKTIRELAPAPFAIIPPKVRKQRTVAQALANRTWVSDITGTLTVQVIVEYLQIWHLVDGMVLQQDIDDHHIWKLSNTGVYSSKSACEAFFTGAVCFAPWKRIWKSWAPLRCKFFLWLAIL